MEPGDCIICFDSLEEETCTTLKCTHISHETCINGWDSISRKCPMCRKAFYDNAISTVEIDDTTHEIGEHNTAIIWAVNNRDIELVNYLIRSGANIN